MSRADEIFPPEQRRRAMEWAQTPHGRQCLADYSAAARKQPPPRMTPERRAEREYEDLRALAGIALVCLVYTLVTALYTYLTTGGL